MIKFPTLILVLFAAGLATGGEKTKRFKNTGAMGKADATHAKISGMMPWKTVATLPQSVGGACAALCDKGLLVAGGSYWLGEQKFYSDKVWQLIGNTKWNALPPLPAPAAYGAGLLSADGAFMWLGGLQPQEGGGKAKPSADCWRLGSSFSGKWEKDASLPYPLVHFGVLAVDGEIVLIGGTSDWVGNMHAELWCRHPNETVWRKAGLIPDGGRIMFASVVHKGRVFIFGGLSECGCNENKDIPHTPSAWSYDPKDGKWERLPDMPVSAYSSCAVPFGDGILLVGGHGRATEEAGEVRFLTECYFYDPERKTYQLYGHLPQGLLSHATVSDGTTVWVGGGEDLPRHRSDKILMTKIK